MWRRSNPERTGAFDLSPWTMTVRTMEASRLWPFQVTRKPVSVVVTRALSGESIMSQSSMQIASFFSGIGGLELGLERAGLGPTVFQCENDPFCLKVLKKHWPDVQRHEDITTLEPGDIPEAEVWCGGFPCQDLSDAGSGWERPGLDGKRSGLASSWMNLIYERRPRLVIIENVAGGAKGRWVPKLRCQLQFHGYSSVPLEVRAQGVGAPFRGSRIFLVAKAYSYSEPASTIHAQMAKLPEPPGLMWQDWGKPSSRALGVANGVRSRMDRLRALGNAVVPQCAEEVGRRVIQILNPGICTIPKIAKAE